MRTLLSFTLWSVQVVLCAVFFPESWWVAWRRGVWLHNCWRCVRFMNPEWSESDMSLLRWYWRWCSCRPPRRKLKMECSSYRSRPIVGSFQGLRPFKSELDVFLLLSSARNRDIFATQVPGLCREVPHTRVDWNYTISPQAGLNGRGPGYPWGKLLGGCSSHSKWSGILNGPADQVWFKDGLVYTRGAKDDWNRWAEIIGDDAYSWDRMIPFLLKVSFCDSQNLMNVPLTYKGITRVKSWFRIRKIKLKRGISIHLSTVMEGQCPILHPTITTQSTRCSYRQHKICQLSSHTWYEQWKPDWDRWVFPGLSKVFFKQS